MKKLLLAIALLITSSTLAQIIPNSARQVGDYLGVMLPSSALCSTERLIVEIHVYSDNTLEGDVYDWDFNWLWTFETGWPLFNRGVFKTSTVPTLESNIRGTFSPATGTVSGTMNWKPDGGCAYTFKAWRRYKLN